MTEILIDNGQRGGVLSNMTMCPSNNLSLYIPRFQTARLQRSIKYKGVKVWNAIPTNIQPETPRLFKTKLKKHILSNYN